MTLVSIDAGEPPTAAEIKLAREIRQLDNEALPKMRAAAEKWRTGTALAGVGAAVVGLATGPSSVAGLTAHLQLAVGLTLGLAVLLTVASIGLALRASYGWPVEIDSSSVASVAQWTRTETKKTKGALAWSMGLALPALFSFAIAVGLVTFGPGAADSGVKITMIDGTELCVDAVDRSGGSLYRENGNRRVAIDMDDVAAIRSEINCSTD